MKNLVTFTAVYSLDFGYFFCKNAQTSDQKHCDFSELPDIHSLDIVICGPYALISDEELI
jgi:ATP sulfurylase